MTEISPVGSPRDSMIASPITIKKGRKGYGLTLKSIRVYIGDSNDYRIHHIIEVSYLEGRGWGKSFFFFFFFFLHLPVSLNMEFVVSHAKYLLLTVRKFCNR